MFLGQNVQGNHAKGNQRDNSFPDVVENDGRHKLFIRHLLACQMVLRLPFFEVEPIMDVGYELGYSSCDFYGPCTHLFCGHHRSWLIWVIGPY